MYPRGPSSELIVVIASFDSVAVQAEIRPER